MGDFERELRETKLQAEREAELKMLQAKQKEAERQRRDEQATREREIKRKQEFERNVLPVKPMVDRLLRAMGSETWGSYYGLRFVEGSWPFPRDYDYSGYILAEWRVGRTRTPTYSVRQPASRLRRWLGGQGDVMKHSESSVPEILVEEPHFALAFIENDGNFWFSVPQRDDSKLEGTPPLFSAKIEEGELRDLLKLEFIRGPRYFSRHLWSAPPMGDWAIHGDRG